MARKIGIRANREYAGTSVGPHIPEHKRRFSRKRFKRRSDRFPRLLLGEDPAALFPLLNDFRARFQPADTHEDDLVVRMAVNHWRLLGCLATETAIFKARIRELRRNDPAGNLDRNPNSLLARAFVLDCNGPNDFGALMREETRLDREAERCLRELMRLRAARARKQ